MVAHSTTSGGRPELPLAAEFPEPTREQWQAQVHKVLERSGLVRSHKQGRVRTYALEPRSLAEAVDWLAQQTAGSYKEADIPLGQPHEKAR